MPIDLELFLHLHSLSRFNPETWLFLAGWFGAVIIFGALLFVSTHKHGFKSPFKEFSQHAREWRALIFVPLATWATVGFLKLAFSAPRPYETLDLNPLSMPGTFDSFPSGHAAFYMALALAVYKYHKKAGLFFITLAGALGVARIVTGVHYPFDIFGGWIVAYMFYKLIK